MLESLVNKVAGLQAFSPATLLKRDPTQLFSCKHCETFKSSFFYRTLPVLASVVSWKPRSNWSLLITNPHSNHSTEGSS